MAFTYDKLWNLLKERNMSKEDLRKMINSSQTTIVSLGRNKSVSLDVIDRMCLILRCTPDDIMEYIVDEKHYSLNIKKVKYIDEAIIQLEKLKDNITEY